MKLVILPGNSKENKEWAQKATDYFKGSFAEIYVQNYDHWDTGEYLIDIEKESEKLRDAIGNDEVQILAKSIGGAVIVNAVHNKYIHPSRCTFLGFPIRWMKKNDIRIEEWFTGYVIPTAFFHNDNDPVSSYEELMEFMQDFDCSNFTFAKVKGDNHMYDDFGLYK